MSKTENQVKTKVVAGKKPRLLEFYNETVVPGLMKELKMKNRNEVPRVDKIVINAGLGDVKDNAKSFNAAVDEIAIITGQKPVVTLAKKSVSNFKLRQGMRIGAKVTLRGNQMYEFLDRLISVALPRVRDFRGVSPKSFDSKGNYNMGIKEQLVFPEISYDKIEKVRGFDVCIVTTASNDAEAKALLDYMGMPFKKN
ncbi:MAG: 50S ribosomal protein L5 [Firmicutes bacterium]|nr:50S ribosomal protein L5 [Bacillota bacterium]